MNSEEYTKCVERYLELEAELGRYAAGLGLTAFELRKNIYKHNDVIRNNIARILWEMAENLELASEILRLEEESKPVVSLVEYKRLRGE